MESSHPAWQTGVQFVLCRRRSPSSQVTFASICALCEEKWQCKQHTFALPMFTKKTPKMLFWKEHYCWKWRFVGFYVSKFSGVFLAQPNRSKMASEWLGFGDSFCGKTVRQWRGYTYHRCASTKNIYVLYIIHMHIHVTQHPNYLGNLQQSWDDCDYEFMTMITTTIRMFLHRLSTTISATMINLNCHYDYYNILQY